MKLSISTHLFPGLRAGAGSRFGGRFRLEMCTPWTRRSGPPSRQPLSRSPIMRRLASWLALLALVAGIAALPARIASHPAANPDFVHFESSHVHPASITPDGSKLLVVNTPDNRLTVFDLTTASPTRIAEIPVGLEPVSVAAR